MSRKLGLPSCLVFALVSMAPVPSQQITWTQTDVNPSTAQILIYTLSINEEGNPTPRVVGLLNVLCGGTAPNSECSTVLPAQANSAIVTGNVSQLSARDPNSGLTSPFSMPFTGNQGCIFRDNLHPVGGQAQAQTNKQNMNTVLNEFKRAKFKHVSTTSLKGNQYLVVEECVGYIVP